MSDSKHIEDAVAAMLKAAHEWADRPAHEKAPEPFKKTIERIISLVAQPDKAGVVPVLVRVKNIVWGYKHVEGECPDEKKCELCLSLGEIEEYIYTAIAAAEKGEK